MPHGHGGAGENPEEIRVFADSILKDHAGLPVFTGSGRMETKVWATYTSPVPIVKAELNFTKDSGRWQDRKWESIDAELTDDRVAANLPEGAQVTYFNLFDQRGCVVSAEHAVCAP